MISCWCSKKTSRGATALSCVLVMALVMIFGAGHALSQSKKPISKAGLLEAVRLNGLSTKELIEHVQQRGVSFQLTSQDEAEFRAAGARPELIEAIRANYRSETSPNPGSNAVIKPRNSRPTVPAGAPLSKSEIVTMLQSGVASSRVEEFVEARGVSFTVTKEIAREIVDAGGTRSLIGAITENSAASSNSRPAPKAAAAKRGPDYDDLTDEAQVALRAENVPRAITLLRQAINMDQSQPTAYTLLGIAELYGNSDPFSASRAMQAAIEHGGAAMFRVYHDHNGFFNNNQWCEGSLFVSKTGITFKADNGNHTFEAERPTIKEVKLNGYVGAQIAAFHIKVQRSGSKTDNYNFAPRTTQRSEANLVIQLYAVK